MKKIVFAIAVVMFLGSHAVAEEVALVDDSTVNQPTTPPATDSSAGSTDDDIKDSHGKSEEHRAKHIKKARKSNFGAIVSAEAHRLKSEGLNGKQKMGPWVSVQARQFNQTNSAKGGSGNSNSASASSSSPGKSAIHKK
jgi:hypothetical protein